MTLCSSSTPPSHSTITSTNTMNRYQRSALHLACANGADSTIQNLLQTHSDAIRTPDSEGNLPLHLACQDRSCSFDTIQLLIEMYPQGLGVRNKKRRTPFGWDYDCCPGGFFVEFVRYFALEADSTFSGSSVRSAGSFDGVAVSASSDMGSICGREGGSPGDGEEGIRTEIDLTKSQINQRRQRHRTLSHLKNYVPIDILKKGFLNEHNLSSGNGLVRYLNEIPCKRMVVCSMVFELYCHIIWIVVFVHATWYWIEKKEVASTSLQWHPIVLLVFAGIFFAEECFQLRRFRKTNATIYYWLDVWNWVELSTSILVAASAVKFLQRVESDDSGTRRLLMASGCFQIIHLVSFLKKTFFPFSKFVSGVIRIFWSLVPFLVISFVTLFGFSYMYYVQDDFRRYMDADGENNPIDPHDTLGDSIRRTFSYFVSEVPIESGLDVLFGIVIMIVLLNVVIAVVSEAWDDATKEANAAFWSYRLDLILEKTRGIEAGKLLRPSFLPSFYGLIQGIDDFYINSETVGTTTNELWGKLALAYRENDVSFCATMVLKSSFFILLGFLCFGYSWPKFFRQILFTPPQPKQDESKAELDRIRQDFFKYKQRAAAEKDVHNQSMLECKKEIKNLSEKLNAQTDLIEKLLQNLE